MADAETLIDRFLQDQDDFRDAWLLYSVNPYSAAYESALQAFKDKLKEQEDADKALAQLKFELMMVGLSLCGGGLLTAAFGTATVSSLAGRGAIHMICNYNMDRAFRAANVIATNKTAGFIAGKVWEEAEKRTTDYLTGAIKDGMAQTTMNFPSTQQLGTVAVSKSLENFVLEAKLKGAGIAKAARDNSQLDGPQKLAEIEKLRKSPFYTPPKKSVDSTGDLTDQIELAFYMDFVMNSDYLITHERYRTTEHDGLARIPVTKSREVKTPITESWRSPSYPPVNSDQQIGYRSIGSIIRDRMNGLHKKFYNENFMSGSSLNDQLIFKAEKVIEGLAGLNIKRRLGNLPT